EVTSQGLAARVTDARGQNKPDAKLSFVPQLVARQAAENPEAIALQSATQALTYGELDRQANQLANHLKAIGVGPEKLVALYLERSPQMVVAALAILKAGGAYLPLDPSFPAERVERILQDADVCAVIIRSEMSCTLPAGKWRVVDLNL